MEKTRMNKTDKMLFRQALIEAFVRKYERELNECQETAVCSEAHTRRMNEIISQSAQRERRKDHRKWIVALLVAAALLLTACSVYAYQDEIRSFIEKVYEDYIKVTYDDESENKIALDDIRAIIVATHQVNFTNHCFAKLLENPC